MWLQMLTHLHLVFIIGFDICFHKEYHKHKLILLKKYNEVAFQLSNILRIFSNFYKREVVVIQ